MTHANSVVAQLAAKAMRRNVHAAIVAVLVLICSVSPAPVHAQAATAAAATSETKQDSKGRPYKDTGVGCAAGAVLGSVVPGLGTAIGCVVGGFIGWWRSP